MTITRAWSSASVLQNGKVLVAGGSTDRTAELYDPSTKMWTTTSELVVGRWFHTATVLRNGKVLITGGTTRWEIMF
jgi:hypothetical protein